MVEHKTKKRPARQRTKKCPNCGQKTVVDDKWSSCQWCHWPLFVKHPSGIEQGKSTLWTSTWRGALACVVVVIIVCGLALFAHTGWKLPAFQQLILVQWRAVLFWIFIGSVIALSAFYLIVYLATRIRPEFIFVFLVAIGILLLIASEKGNPYSQYISGLIDKWLNINLFSASITVLSLAFAFAAILISNGRTKK
jgi:hypothetical protein